MSKLDMAVALIVTGVVMIPAIVGNHMTTPIHEDTVAHVKVFTAMANGESVNWLYAGQAIVGYPLVWLSRLTNVSIMTLFVWFNYLSFAAAMFTIYLVVCKLVNTTAGILSIPIVFFSTLSNMRLFSSGNIFNLINMSIILPWFGYYLIKSITHVSIRHVASMLVLGGLFATFHKTGVYITGSTLQIDGIPVALATVPSAWDYIYFFLSPVTFLLLVESIMFMKWRWLWELDECAKLLIGFLIIGAMIITIAAYTISPVPIRQILDATTLIAVLTSVLLGIVVTRAAVLQTARKKMAIVVARIKR